MPETRRIRVQNAAYRLRGRFSSLVSRVRTFISDFVGHRKLSAWLLVASVITSVILSIPAMRIYRRNIVYIHASAWLFNSSCLIDNAEMTLNTGGPWEDTLRLDFDATCNPDQTGPDLTLGVRVPDKLRADDESGDIFIRQSSRDDPDASTRTYWYHVDWRKLAARLDTSERRRVFGSVEFRGEILPHSSQQTELQMSYLLEGQDKNYPVRMSLTGVTPLETISSYPEASATYPGAREYEFSPGSKPGFYIPSVTVLLTSPEALHRNQLVLFGLGILLGVTISVGTGVFTALAMDWEDRRWR